MDFCSRASTVGGFRTAGGKDGATTGPPAGGADAAPNPGGGGVGVQARAGHGNGTQCQAGGGARAPSGVIGASGSSSARAVLAKQRPRSNSEKQGVSHSVASPPSSAVPAGFLIGIFLTIGQRIIGCCKIPMPLCVAPRALPHCKEFVKTPCPLTVCSLASRSFSAGPTFVQPRPPQLIRVAEAIQKLLAAPPRDEQQLYYYRVVSYAKPHDSRHDHDLEEIDSPAKPTPKVPAAPPAPLPVPVPFKPRFHHERPRGSPQTNMSITKSGASLTAS